MEWEERYTVCPTCYQTRHFFNNFTTNEDIATKLGALQTHTTDTFLFISHTTNVPLFNIFIGVGIIKEMPGSVESGTLCILIQRNLAWLQHALKCVIPVMCIISGKGIYSQKQQCIYSRCYIYTIIRKLHVSACGGHHQVSSIDCLRVSLHESRTRG
jgi:hypothetical protein